MLIAEAIGDPVLPGDAGLVQGPPARAVEAAARLSELLRKAADQITAGEPAEQVLWTVWDGTRWPTRLQAEAEGDGDGSARANHDLDAVCALFAEAARAEEREAHGARSPRWREHSRRSRSRATRSRRAVTPATRCSS